MPDAVNALNSRLTPLGWVVRTRGEPHALSAAIQKALRQASGGLPVADIKSMDEIVVAVDGALGLQHVADDGVRRRRRCCWRRSASTA